MKRMIVGKLAIATAALSIMGPAQAQFDPAIFAKWGSVAVLKFKLVQTYEGERIVIKNGAALATVKDRFEVEFRWNQYEARLVGEPVIKNYPTVMSGVRGSAKECPAPTLAGPFEHATAVSAVQGEGAFLLVTLRTDYPAASEPQMCSQESSKTVPAASEDQAIMVPPPGIAIFGMKDGQAPGITVKGDTVTMRDGELTNVWTIAES
ncbi:MAG: hypothetical protein U5J99_04040 [Parvularculaceae bacterium]|nr:hypothetical protein [Parvularculaceae bacterium]